MPDRPGAPPGAPPGPAPGAPGAPGSAPAVPSARLDEVELRLSFRAGEALLDLATLRALAPGSIVETGDEAGAQVDILVNGRAVGTGELIEVAGRRAVQVRTLFAGG